MELRITVFVTCLVMMLLLPFIRVLLPPTALFPRPGWTIIISVTSLMTIRRMPWMSINTLDNSQR
ncbi:hypothetical protein F5H01DRAFT_352099 [Linnemannia elongata]|nr:hypothetical protein F5H01DRAFT_352099 [Linnemannia elongata]